MKKGCDNGKGNGTPLPKPPWLRVRLPWGENYSRLKNLFEKKSLHTVCEAALCPNLAECWGKGTATFMILGDQCTRNCRFCAVKPAVNPSPPNPEEPGKVGRAVRDMGLKHAVVTSVTRDDLADGGAGAFADTIRRIRLLNPLCTTEVLIPDFQGKPGPVEAVLAAGPDIFGHNVETVPELYAGVRPKADYRRSLAVLEYAKKTRPRSLIKSGIMLGLGESREQLARVIGDLRRNGCDILTLGQYLRPSKRHLPVARYYTPAEFEELKNNAYRLGFFWVESGPFVRSSYRADQQAARLRQKGACESNGW